MKGALTQFSVFVPIMRVETTNTTFGLIFCSALRAASLLIELTWIGVRVFGGSGSKPWVTIIS